MKTATRRRVLGYAGLGTIAHLFPCFPSAAKGADGSRLGLQLYTLGNEFSQHTDDMLRQVAEIGYREVELPQLYQLSPQRLRRAFDAAGMQCPSMHVPFQSLYPGDPTLSQPATIIEAAHVIGARHVVLPVFEFPKRLVRDLRPDEDIRDMVTQISQSMTVADWKRLAERLNSTGRVLQKAGIRMGYHNHNIEFARIADGPSPLEILLADTDPALVDFELDVGWVAAAGLDPVRFLQEHRTRISQLHLKDLAPTPANTAIRMNPADAGKGIIDWPKLVATIRRSHVEHMYVEQEPPFLKPRIQSAKEDFLFLHSAFAGT